VQQTIAKENENRPAGERMRFRIGVHLGDVIVDGDNLFGDGVNITARLQALAEPGGICLSGAVRDQLGTRLPVTLTARGEQRFKNIVEPVRAFKVGGTRLSAAKARPTRVLGAAAVAAILTEFRIETRLGDIIIDHVISAMPPTPLPVSN
jgi:adenylate cyclase